MMPYIVIYNKPDTLTDSQKIQLDTLIRLFPIGESFYYNGRIHTIVGHIGKGDGRWIDGNKFNIMLFLSYIGGRYNTHAIVDFEFDFAVNILYPVRLRSLA